MNLENTEHGKRIRAIDFEIPKRLACLRRLADLGEAAQIDGRYAAAVDRAVVHVERVFSWADELSFLELEALVEEAAGL